MLEGITLDIANTALDIGFAVRKRINEIPRTERAKPCTSVLKPYDENRAKFADAEGERVGFELLEGLSRETSLPIVVVVDPKNGRVYEIGNPSSGEISYCYFDAVDGTIKVAGLGNDPGNGIYRVGNNGCWATGIAFTNPTKKDLSDLVVGDFKISAIVDGNPTQYRAYPTNAVCKGGGTFESAIGNFYNFYKLGTSSQTNLNQATLLFDDFQAFDRNSAKPGTEKLALEIYRRIINRNEDGAFDIVRLYGNMGETLRQLLERKEGGIESQGVGAITLNDNLPNLVPITPIVEGAGGYVTDFDGNPIREMRLIADRPNVIISANEQIRDKLKEIVYDASC